jgi:hypothetical protein
MSKKLKLAARILLGFLSVLACNSKQDQLEFHLEKAKYGTESCN